MATQKDGYGTSLTFWVWGGCQLKDIEIPWSPLAAWVVNLH